MAVAISTHNDAEWMVQVNWASLDQSDVTLELVVTIQEKELERQIIGFPTEDTSVFGLRY